MAYLCQNYTYMMLNVLEFCIFLTQYAIPTAIHYFQKIIWFTPVT